MTARVAVVGLLLVALAGCSGKSATPAPSTAGTAAPATPEVTAGAPTTTPGPATAGPTVEATPTDGGSAASPTTPGDDPITTNPSPARVTTSICLAGVIPCVAPQGQALVLRSLAGTTGYGTLRGTVHPGSAEPAPMGHAVACDFKTGKLSRVPEPELATGSTVVATDQLLVLGSYETLSIQRGGYLYDDAPGIVTPLPDGIVGMAIADRRVAGYQTDGNGSDRAILYSVDTGAVTDLASLIGAEGSRSYAAAIGSRYVVGYKIDAATGTRAWAYDLQDEAVVSIPVDAAASSLATVVDGDLIAGRTVKGTAMTLWTWTVGDAAVSPLPLAAGTEAGDVTQARDGHLIGSVATPGAPDASLHAFAYSTSSGTLLDIGTGDPALSGEAAASGTAPAQSFGMAIGEKILVFLGDAPDGATGGTSILVDIPSAG